MAAQGADGYAVVFETLFEFFKRRSVIEHGQLAVRIAWIVAGAEFDGRNVEGFQFGDNRSKGELGQE
jgi:hypothetical protein